GLVDPAPRDWDEEPGNGGFLFNGARVYLDSGHLEYATAECRTLDDIVEQENAGNAILLDTVEAQELNRRVFFVKNNTDYLGNTFGYHENYSVRLNPRGRDAVFGMMPFLVTRQLFAGAGMVDLAAGRDGRLPYHMSQRAAFVTVDVSRRVRFGGRPIINLRDEPLAEAKGLRRLHVIVGDANCSEYATALKVGTTALVAQLLERGWDPDMYLEEPVAALKGISRSPGGPWTVALVDRGTVGALEIQRRYLDAAQQAYAGRDADTDWTLGAWTECLDALADDPDRLIGKVDWLTKLARLRDFVADAPKGWADPDLVKVDLAYHHIDPAVSLYAELQRRGKLERRVHTPPNALATPVGTRAIGRARVVRALAAAHADAAIDWDAITKNLGSVANWENQLYLVYQYIDDWKELTALGGWNVIPYLIDWAGIGVRGQVIEMPDPFQTYASQAEDFAGQVARYLGR
ncbi:MAG: proteasome accessory factor PafA2 family protein, partial [Actinobacteria bacterium]|nr:proteasome accessory factor PafA2 family protein [Actinomycetota bacterium]